MTLAKQDTGARQRGLRGMMGKLVHNEDGALIILSLQLFILMLVCTGIAIDLVRVEERRAVVQNTLDRAALAAASLSQKLEPEVVVKDYLQKAGLDYLDVRPKVEEGSFNEWRRVTVTAKDTMPTAFGWIMGVNYLSSGVGSQATESVGNVEISLVLDVSGSMNDAVGYDTRIGLLRTAAKAFVNDMFEVVQPPTAPAGRLSISVVPYNQQVSMGADLASVYSLSDPGYPLTCADVTMLPTNSIAISPSDLLQRTMIGDSFDHYEYNISKTLNCPEFSYSAVLPFSNDKLALTNKIDALRASGDTAIDVGARWGLALLDPSAQPALTSLIAKNKVKPELAGRPLAYDDGTKPVDQTSMKVLVLMTDGQNTRSYSTKSQYRTVGSPFYSTKGDTFFNASDKNGLYYHVTTRTNDPYYRYKKDAYGNWTGEWVSALPNTAVNVTWPTIWSKGYTLREVIDNFIYAPRKAAKKTTTAESIYAEMAIQSEFAGKDTALASLCTTAKQQNRNIVIFTVAVDAPSAGKSILKQCATADTYAYDVTASDMTNAFASIAMAINSLRLSN